MMRMLAPGEPVPWFHVAALDGSPRYAFNTVGGRWMVMLVIGSGEHPGFAAAMNLVSQNRALFDDANACFFGVTTDPADAEARRIAQVLPGIRWFLDYDGAVSRKLGAIDDDAPGYRAHWLLIDPLMRLHMGAPLSEGAAIFAALRDRIANAPIMPGAPVLVVPDVFSPTQCRQLIDLYDKHGGQPSGFMRDEGGITVMRTDPLHKKRADYLIEDEALIAPLKHRLATALRPMIARAFQFDVTRIERFIVACYDSEDGGHFRAHRDNTTAGTAHRKFACTINLNAEEYDGGDLSFPEFGTRTYRAPTGGAVVFSCSLLHEVRPMTRGRRYAFLPFFYDDDGARLREANLVHVNESLKGYRSGLTEESV